MSIDQLYLKRYDPRYYHCVHFTIDAAFILFNKDFKLNFEFLDSSLDNCRVTLPTLRRSKKLLKPREGCIVLMKSYLGDSHVGLFVEGAVLHLSEYGVSHQSIHQLSGSYTRFRFYDSKDI